MNYLWAVWILAFQLNPPKPSLHLPFKDTVLEMEILFNASPHPSFYCFIFRIVFIYFSLTIVSLSCGAWAFSSCNEQGLLFVAMHGLLLVVISLVVKHQLQACGLQWSQYTGSVVAALGLSCTWNPPRPGIEPMSSALAGGLLTTGPPGEALSNFFCFYIWIIDR